MTRATAPHPVPDLGSRGDRRLPVVAGGSPEDLDRVAAALTEAGVEFEVEERLVDPEKPGDWAWRVLIRPADLGRARNALEQLLRSTGLAPAGGTSPAPFFDPGGYDLLRSILVLACLGLAVFLLLR
jgi:hypothetical protein